jgi:DNA-binding NarL/FixJ family response regulator
MTGIVNLNLKVLILDTDFYALQAINSYLAWDRRTRVTCLAESLEQMWAYIDKTPMAEQPDVVLMDADHIGGPEALRQTILRLQAKIADVKIVCLAQIVAPELVEIAANNRVEAYLLKQEVRLKIAWAIIYALDHDFVVTAGVMQACHHLFNTRIFHASVLPEQRDYPELTDRIRQAIQLCVIEGMPAHLAADEMGISLHTIRGYIKEGYRILEAYDDHEYPVDMTPQERAFMRFTALAEHDEEEEAEE